MNWDISIGHTKQFSGRLLQFAGRQLASRKLVLQGESIEYAGRLQMRYGLLKHQAQWGKDMAWSDTPALIRVASPIAKATVTARERFPT